MEKLEREFSLEIPEHYFGVLHVEMRTGIVIDLYGKRISGENIQYLIFPSLGEAHSYAKRKVQENPEMECLILDDAKDQLEVVKDWEYVNRIADELRDIREAKKKKWWKVW